MGSPLLESPAACPVCKGFGLLESEGGRKLVPCRCREGTVREARRKSARVPPRYASCTIDQFRAQNESQLRAQIMARKFVENWPSNERGLLFMGPVGVGKTHLAVAVLSELVGSAGVPGIFCDVTGLIGRIQSSFSKSNESNPEEILEPYREARLLVLDELGARRPTEFSRDLLYELLNTRYNSNRLTLLTTNFLDLPDRPGGETLELRVGTAVRSRLAEMCHVVEMSGEDYRRRPRPGIRT